MLDKRCYTVKQASELMGITQEFLRRMIEQGRIPGATFTEGKRRSYYIPARPLEEWLGIRKEEA